MKLMRLLLLILPLFFFSCGDNTPANILPEIPEEAESLEFYQIPATELQDWAEGIANNAYYITATLNNDAPCVYVSTIDKNNGVLFRFNKDGEIMDISNNSSIIVFSTHNNLQTISWISINNEFCCIPSELRFNNLSIGTNTRGGDFSLLQPNNIRTLFDIIQNIQSIEEIRLDLFSSDMLEFLKDLGNFSFDLILGTNPLGIPVVTLKDMIGGMYDSLYERHRLAMYGDCSIKIDEISNDGKGNINVFVTIEKANTIPENLYHLYYNESEEDTKNIVYWGVVGRNGSVPRKYFFTDPYKELRLLDTSISSPQHLMVSFPMPKKGDKFIFRAFLASTRLANSIDDVNDNIIKYSDNYTYNILDGYIVDFKQISSERINNKINFICSVRGYIDSIDDLIEWGVYYVDDENSYFYFPSKFSLGYNPDNGISSPNEDSIEIQFSIDFDKLDDNFYKDIKLGIYTKGGFNLTYNGWSEPQIYSVRYVFSLCPDDNHPHMIDLGLPSGTKWSCCNFGATKPLQNGKNYAWGELEPKTTYKKSTYKYAKEIKINEYQYKYEYIFIGTDISGTEYDVAHVKWDNGWHMPTKAQIDELVQYCSYEWTTINGVEGVRFTGLNGNHIFIPVGNFSTDSQHVSGGVWLWSSTLVPIDDNISNAYNLCIYKYGLWPNNWNTSSRFEGLRIRPVHN